MANEEEEEKQLRTQLFPKWKKVGKPTHTPVRPNLFFKKKEKEN